MAHAGDITDEYPHLKQYVYAEDETPIHFGFGLSPLRIMKNSAGVALSVFQVHYTSSWLDWEIFNASFGTSFSGDATSKVNSYTFHMVPKLRLSEAVSIGILGGYEFVNFSDVTARLYKGNDFTPEEPFSSGGVIYGLALSETYPIGKKGLLLKIQQLAYKQNYKTAGTSRGWNYDFTDNLLDEDASSISPGYVFRLEFSLLY
jgi:hypothetical protein